MKTSLLQRRCPRSLLVFRAHQLAGTLCALPALRALRAACPQARLSVLGLPETWELLRRHPDCVDEFLAFPGFPGLPGQRPTIAAIPGFLAELQARRFDLAIQMRDESPLASAVVALCDAAASTGFASEDEVEAALPYPGQGSEIHRLLALTDFLGAPRQGEELAFPLEAGDWQKLADSGLASDHPTGCVSLHPHSGATAERWPPQAWAAVADTLHSATGLPLVLSATGTAADAVRAATHPPLHQPRMPLPLGALAAHLGSARLVISDDKDVAQLCAALQRPSVHIFRGVDMDRWAPLARGLHRSVWAPTRFNLDDGVAEVLRQAEVLLAGGHATGAPAPA